MNSDRAPTGSAKAFKGKGEPGRRVRQIEVDLGFLERRMRQLVAETRGLRGRQFGLNFCRKGANGARRLRWRMTAGNDVVWARDILPLVSTFPVELRSWYSNVNTEAQLLNAEEQVLRFARKTYRRLFERVRE